jgi:hypothetical protein
VFLAGFGCARKSLARGRVELAQVGTAKVKVGNGHYHYQEEKYPGHANLR